MHYALGQEIVVLPVRENETDIMPYTLQVTVKTSIDANFPRFRTTLTIDGRTSVRKKIHGINEQVLNIKCMDSDYLGLGPITQSTSSGDDSSSFNEARVGSLTVKVGNCKKRSKTKKKTRNATLPIPR